MERERRWKSSRHGRGGGDRDAEKSEDNAGKYWSWDDGTETSDAQVSKLFFVVALQHKRERGPRQVRSPPPSPGRKTREGLKRSERVKKSSNLCNH